MRLILKRFPFEFSVCKLKSIEDIDLSKDYCFASKTDEEISLVCPTENIQFETLEREDGWRAFRIDGVLDFSLIGILSDISAILSEKKIGIFVISTFNTDYVLVKAKSFDRAIAALKNRGYDVE